MKVIPETRTEFDIYVFIRNGVNLLRDKIKDAQFCKSI